MGFRKRIVGLSAEINPAEDRMYTVHRSGWWFQTFFIFTPSLGEMIQFDDHIFQMG